MKPGEIELDGLDGLVYLMYLGRETYAGAWKDRIVEAGLILNAENVDQSSVKLEKRGYLNRIRVEKMPGSPVIRTADEHPVFETIKVRGRGLSDEEQARLYAMIRDFSGCIDHFPQELGNTFTTAGSPSIQGTPWVMTLYAYLGFLGKLLIFIKNEALMDAPAEEVTVPHVVEAMGLEPVQADKSVGPAREAVRSLTEDERRRLSERYDLERDGQRLLWPVMMHLAFGPWLGKVMYHMSMHTMSGLKFKDK